MLPTMVSWLDKVFSDGKLVPLALAIIAVVLLMSSVRRRLRQHEREVDRSSPQREPPRVTPKVHLRRDLESLIGELQELSRKISAQIDTRFAKLEASIRDADRRIAVLNRLTRQRAEERGEADAEPEDHDARHTVVYELADAGFSAVEIARDVGKTPGEVELILNLRRQTDAQSTAGDSPSAPSQEMHGE